MKKILLLTLVTFNLFASDDCINKYRKKHFKKTQNYQKEMHKYQLRRDRNLNAMVSSGLSGRVTLGGVLASSSIRNDKAPSKAEYNMFEEPIIKAFEFNLSQEHRYKPQFLEELYNEALAVDGDTTYEKIQALLRSGMKEGEFCNWYGIAKADGVKKYVLRNLSRMHTINPRDLSINDSTVNEPEYIEDNPSQRPLNTIQAQSN